MALEYDAIVTNNLDPDQKGRVMVRCEMLNLDGAEYPDWISPSFSFAGGDSSVPFGMFFIPPVDSAIKIQVIQQGPIQSVRWICGLYTDEHPVPSEFKINYPFRKGIVTPGGHVIIIDDLIGLEAFSYTHPSGATITVDPVGMVAINGTTVTLGGVPSILPAEPALKGDTFCIFFDAHVQTCPILGESGPPKIPTISVPLMKSLIVKIE